MNPTKETVINHSGIANHFNASPKFSGVCAFIIHNSHPAIPEVPIATRLNNKLWRAERSLNHTNPCTPARVNEDAAAIAQITVTQFTG